MKDPINAVPVMDVDDDHVTNVTENRPFADILATRLKRRSVVRGGLAGAAAFMTPMSLLAQPGGFSGNYLKAAKGPLMDFTPVAIADGSGPVPAVSPDYEYQTLIPWGTPIQPGGPEYDGDPTTRPTAAEQAQMVGIGHDGMWFFPERSRGRQSSKSGMLAINHEFGNNFHVLGKAAPESLEDVRLSQHAHGVSVIAIEEIGGAWRPVANPNNRRIHVNTPVTFSGPVADHPLIDPIRGDYRGTVNNCASGYTPWGTYLTCEENFNGYFGATGAWTPTEAQQRYGFSSSGFGYGWENFDERFDLSNPDYAGEENRFGWVVEIDPMDGSRLPVKRTALGRVKHEGAEVVVGQGGRAVVYMGDDQRFDYIYKFVSADNWRSMLGRGVSPLDEGSLYVAKFYDNGVGEWLELTIDDPKLAAVFADQAEVLTFARMAADILGATPMDRPEWISVAPDEQVYCTLTNNSRRTAPDPGNPLVPNPDGHIIRWKDTHKHTGTEFEWDIYLIAANTHAADREDTFSDPDGLWADPDGRVFIETDGGQKKGLNNQLLVSDAATGETRRLLTGVTGDEITGLTVTPDRRTLFCNTQHPGNGDPSLTNFPAPTDGTTIPRDCTIVLRRKDGGIVGS